MRKKGLAIFILAAALTIGTATISVLAAEGWAQSSGSWVYYSSSGSKVTSEWRKGADNLWRYLNGSGVMAVNSWVENTYYVDADGKLVSDRWVKLQDPSWNQYNSTEQFRWYYFGSSGKAITDTWKKIDDKWYYFDDDGAMLTGWILDDMYYTSDDGVMRIGWQKLVPPNTDDNEDRITPGFGNDINDDGKNYYYFASNGKKYIPDSDGYDYAERKIDSVYYCFNTEGAMQIGWRNIKSDSDSDTAPISDYKYFGDDGKAKLGWLSLEPPEKLAGQYDGNVEWFYFGTNGTPKAKAKDGTASASDFTKINGITYLFNDKGNPVYGLQKIQTGNSDDSYTAYYFGEKSVSSVVRGKRKIEEGDGSTSEFYFTDTGRGYTGVKDSYLYYMGKLQKADNGTKYEAISIRDGGGSNTYVVNTSGKVAKSTTVKSSDGVKYKTGSSGNLLQVDDESPGNGSYRDPMEPVWQE